MRWSPLDIFGTSDEAWTKFTAGGYDVVSASGDLSFRLFENGYVQPVNVDLVAAYPDIVPALKDQPYNTVRWRPLRRPARPRRQPAHVADRRRRSGADPGPRSSTRASPYAGKITAYDAAIYIADAAVVLMSTNPELGITNPYALDETQFAGGRRRWPSSSSRSSATTGPTAAAQIEPTSAMATSCSGRPGRSTRTTCSLEDPPVAGRERQAGRRFDGLVRHVDDRGRHAERELCVPVAQPHHVGAGPGGADRVVGRGPRQLQGLRAHAIRARSATSSMPHRTTRSGTTSGTGRRHARSASTDAPRSSASASTAGSTPGSRSRAVDAHLPQRRCPRAAPAFAPGRLAAARR